MNNNGLTWESAKDKLLVGTAGTLLTLCGYGVFQLQKISDQVSQLNINLVSIQILQTTQTQRLDQHREAITSTLERVNELEIDMATVKERVNKL